MLKLNSNVMAASVAEATQVAPGGCCCCCCCSCCVSVNTGSGSSSGGSPSLQLPNK
ncbi:streptolysin S family TOMM toxin [Streptococcus phocae subsp. salmonis]